MFKKTIKLLSVLVIIQMFALCAAFAADINTIKKSSAQRNATAIQTQKAESRISSSQKIEEIEASEELKKIQKSPIEELFGEENLVQIGYDLFSNTNAISSNSKFTESYVLNVGEKVSVYLYGESIDVISMSGGQVLSPLTTAQIDSNGNIFVPGIGMVKAEGRTIGDVEKNIQGLARQKYSRLNVKITVASDTDFTVYVFGQVNHPGKVSISSNSSILEALGAAGGVKKSGSLRNISYTPQSGKKLTLDLYDLLFNNKRPSVTLQANDVIYVNNIGSVVGITSGVNVPGIYELLPDETISNLIRYAGGETPDADLSTVTISQFDAATGQRNSQDITKSMLKKQTLSNGDIIYLRSKYTKAQDTIKLEGNVKHPLTMAYKEGLKLSDVIKNKNEVMDETFLHQAVITRIVGDDRQTITIPVSLVDLFSGKEDIALQPGDVITVLKNSNLTYINVRGCINEPKKYPFSDGLTLKDVMAGIQFVISSQDTNGNEVQANTVFDNNAKDNNEKVAVVEVKPDENSNKQAVEIKYTPIDAADVAVEITSPAQVTTTYYLYDIMVAADQLSTIILNEGDIVFFRPLRETEVLKTVNVTGYVNRPGVYKFVKGQKILELLNTAGGIKDSADLRGIVLKRTQISSYQKRIAKQNSDRDLRELESIMGTGSAFTKNNSSVESQEALKEGIEASEKKLDEKYDSRIALHITSRDINHFPEKSNIDILDGDQIYVPRYSEHVSVLGEVYNEGAYVYKKGAKSKSYIKSCGGFTASARKTKAYKTSVNGQSKRLGLFANKRIEPGDTIVVPRKIEGASWVPNLLQAVQSIASIVSSLYIVTKL